MAMAVLILMACGPKPIPSESPLDTPQAAYERGQHALAGGDLAQAQIEFDRARQLDPDFAPAHEGLGLVQLAHGKLKEAKKLFKRAKGKDETYVPAWIGMGRAYDAEQRYEKALGEFRQALKRDKSGQWTHTTHYYTGQTYEHMEDYTLAQASYQAALTVKPAYTIANEAWQRMNERQRTMAGMPPEYVAIVKSPAVTRAELAALLANELPLERLFRKPPEQREPMFQAPGTVSSSITETVVISDTQASWAKVYIDRTVTTGAMEVYPGGQFKPAEQVTRAELAQVAQTVLVTALHDPKLATLYVGNASTLTDVSRTHFAFNAITLVINRGIMAPKPDGTFGLTDTVSGTEALRVVRALKQMAVVSEQ